MGIKSDKTFEEIVERLVALFTPEPERHRDSDVLQSPPSTSNTAGTDHSDPLPSTASEDPTQ